MIEGAALLDHPLVLAHKIQLGLLRLSLELISSALQQGSQALIRLDLVSQKFELFLQRCALFLLAGQVLLGLKMLFRARTFRAMFLAVPVSHLLPVARQDAIHFRYFFAQSGILLLQLLCSRLVLLADVLELFVEEVGFEALEARRFFVLYARVALLQRQLRL